MDITMVIRVHSEILAVRIFRDCGSFETQFFGRQSKEKAESFLSENMNTPVRVETLHEYTAYNEDGSICYPETEPSELWMPANYSLNDYGKYIISTRQ